jgi:S-methylmethionine-dependent homocysteine/selenocysteine methylase
MAEQGIKKDCIQKGSDFVAARDLPDVVRHVHTLYAEAGAHVLTADTFCANVGRQNGNAALVDAYIRAATGIAREVSMQSPNHPLVALSLTSIEDCDHPEDTPDTETLIAVHRQNIALLKPHGDFILPETLPTVREGKVIADLLQEDEVPFVMSFHIDENGRVLDGRKMAEVVETILKPHSYCMGVAVNCCLAPGAQRAVSEFRQIFTQSTGLNGKIYGAYINGFKFSREENERNGHGHPFATFSPAEFDEILHGFVEDGAQLIGGCCGSTPEHTKEYVKPKPVPVSIRHGFINSYPPSPAHDPRAAASPAPG